LTHRQLGEMMSKIVTVQLDDETYLMFHSYAKSNNRSIENFMETATLHFIQTLDKPSPEQLLEDEARIIIQTLPQCDFDGCDRRLTEGQGYDGVPEVKNWDLLDEQVQSKLKREFNISKKNRRDNSWNYVIQCPNGCNVCNSGKHQSERPEMILHIRNRPKHNTRHMQYKCKVCDTVWCVEVITKKGDDDSLISHRNISMDYAERVNQSWRREVGLL